jgi:PAP2 superfamily
MQDIAVKKAEWLGLLLWRHSILGLFVVAYVALAFWLSHANGVVVGESKFGVVMAHFLAKVPQMAFIVLFWRLLHLTYVERVPDRIGTLKQEVRAIFADTERMAGAALALFIVAFILIAFAQMKNLIPTLNPFSWDIAFMELDRILHFGPLPHEYLQPLFFHPVLSFFSGIYNMWLFLVYMVLFTICFLRPDSAIRMQFLLAFLLTWVIGGNLLATVFSSAGPVYYALLGLGDTYAGLMDSLNAHAATASISVVETQATLWQVYQADNGINLISAFPSMHVAMSTLIALIGFRVSRWAGWALTAYAVSIQIGSVLLAWHYAVDGYAGALIALLAWKGAGWIVHAMGSFAPARA